MRIITIGHSYVVAMNRRLPHEWALAGHDVTVVPPAFYHADLKPMYCEKGFEEPFRLIQVPCRATIQVHIFQYGHELKRILREEQFDVVHVWQEPFTWAGFQAARWSPQSSALVYSTFQNLPKRYPPPFSWIERYNLGRATAWTAFGETIKSNLSSRMIYNNRPWQTISLGVDMNAFRPEPAWRASEMQHLGWNCEGPPVIGFVGRFVPEKGLRLFMRVLDRISDLGKPWRALFIGGGPMEVELRQWSAKYGENKARVLTGIGHDRVPKLLNSLDMCVVPSQTTPHWQEQLGRILLESMASGVPVIASRSGEIPHVIEQAGVLCREDDEAEWVKAMTGLLDSPARRSELSILGLEQVRKKFDWPMVAKKFTDFFDSILDK